MHISLTHKIALDLPKVLVMLHHSLLELITLVIGPFAPWTSELSLHGSIGQLEGRGYGLDRVVIGLRIFLEAQKIILRQLFVVPYFKHEINKFLQKIVIIILNKIDLHLKKI